MNPLHSAGVFTFGLYSLPDYYPYAVGHSAKSSPYRRSVRLAWPK